MPDPHTQDDPLSAGRRLADAGRAAEALAMLVTNSREAADRADAADLLLESASLAVLIYGPERARELAVEAAELAGGTGTAAEVRALTRLGDALLWCGRYAEAHRTWSRAAAVGAPADASLLCERANAMMRAGLVAPFREAAYEAVVLARTEQSNVMLVDALSLACISDIHSGALREALLSAEQAVAAANADGGSQGVSLLDALGLLAWVTALLGDVERCRGALATAGQLADGLPITAPGGFAEGMLALGLGELDKAIRAFDSKRRELPMSAAAQACGPRPFVPSLAEALARTGQVEQGRALVDAFVPTAMETDQPRIIAPALRAKAVAYADGAAFAEARRWHAGWGNLLEEGRTLLAEGELLRRNKQRGRARVALRDALERFEHVGAATWGNRASRELRAAGDRAAAVPTQRVAAVGHLTQQEAAVIELVEAGLSNRQLAAELFLSVKTVEGHLTAIYDKFGVRSRGQLMAALARRVRSGEQ